MQGVALGPGDCARSGARWQLQGPVLGLIAGYRLKGFGVPLLVVERQLFGKTLDPVRLVLGKSPR